MNTLLNSGDVLNSRYRILHQLGQGGFGRTYLAEDINRFNERCVLKEFAPQLQGTFALSKAQELFEREAEVLYRLQHPQIPNFRELFPYKQENKGRLLLVQDYVEGQTYHQLFNHRARQEKRFSEAEIDQLLCQILPVLEYIHSMGIIHRDISPDNIILRNTDKLPVLIDFGSIKGVENKAQSQLVEVIPNREPLSLIGTVIGKYGYAPPEQFQRGIVFAHSDLYALAATAVVLLTGKKPQQLIDYDSYRWNWQEEVRLNPQLEWVLTIMLSPSPEKRFSSATEVIKMLQDVSVVTPTPQPANPRVTFSQPVKQQPLTKAKYSAIAWQKEMDKPRGCDRNSRVDEPLLIEKLQGTSRLVLLPKTRILPLLLSKLLFYSSFAAVVWLGNLWWMKQQNLAIVSSTISNSHNLVEQKSQLQEGFTQEEKVLIPQTTTPEKELASAALAQENYEVAVLLLSASLKVQIINDDSNQEIGQQVATILNQNPEILVIVSRSKQPYLNKN